MSLIFKFLSLLLFTSVSFAQTQVLQIIHTNDLHSFWEKSNEFDRGGYARVKTIIDQLEEEGRNQGWITLKLDAGDFSEGSIRYFAAQGKRSFEIMKLMGFDAVALGNHDYQTGLIDLAMKSVFNNTRLPLVAANFFSPFDAGVEPGKVFRKGGFDIAVAGATTFNPSFTWAAQPAIITEPNKAVDSWLEIQDADVKIALTHIGVEADKKLASKSKNIHLIIGGHSHTTLHVPTMVKNKNKKLIPIVQVGSRGRYVGQLLIELPIKKEAQVISYDLFHVDEKTLPDSTIEQKIHQSTNDLQNEFKENLFEIVGFSEQNYFTEREPAPLIGNLVTDAMREAAQADVSYDSGFLYGEVLPSGPLSVFDIFELAPHVYNWPTKGWRVFVCDATVSQIKKSLIAAAVSRTPFMVSGMTFRVSGFKQIKDLLIQGQKPDSKKTYRFALSEGLVEAIHHMPLPSKLFCSHYQDTGILLRDAILNKIKTLKLINDETLGDRRVSGLKQSEWKCRRDCE